MGTNFDPEWITAVASVLLAFGLGLTWFQIRKDHERSRREKAVDLILTWARSLDSRGTAARKLGETMSHDQARDLFDQAPFEVDGKHKDKLEAVFSALPEMRGERYAIDSKRSAELRWLIVTYLNSLEAVLASWRHHVADREMISEQFRYLIQPSRGHFILENIRNVADGDRNYPAIAEFVRCLEAERLAPPSPKKRL